MEMIKFNNKLEIEIFRKSTQNSLGVLRHNIMPYFDEYIHVYG